MRSIPRAVRMSAWTSEAALRAWALPGCVRVGTGALQVGARRSEGDNRSEIWAA